MVLRGARQVGKTTLIRKLANERGYLSEAEVKATPLLKSFVQFKE